MSGPTPSKRRFGSGTRRLRGAFHGYSAPAHRSVVVQGALRVSSLWDRCKHGVGVTRQGPLKGPLVQGNEPPHTQRHR